MGVGDLKGMHKCRNLIIGVGAVIPIALVASSWYWSLGRTYLASGEYFEIVNENGTASEATREEAMSLLDSLDWDSAQHRKDAHYITSTEYVYVSSSGGILLRELKASYRIAQVAGYVWDRRETQYSNHLGIPFYRVSHYPQVDEDRPTAWHGFAMQFEHMVAGTAYKDPPAQGTRAVVVLPYWFLTALAGIPGILVGRNTWRDWTRAKRIQRGLCVHCGYDLRGCTDRCPECGAEISRENKRTALGNTNGEITKRDTTQCR